MNRLARETSPYLLQHAGNPVDWYPWGDEALARARAEDKPILLSIGYAACHWCHVMEHESFENGAIAGLMNEHFVNIKVDREERPDLDSIYMQATQAMTGHGGWPMTVFLLPTGEPFYAGTYFPPDDRHGMPGFPRVLQALAAAWREDRDRLRETGARVRTIYEPQVSAGESPRLARTHLDQAVRRLDQQFDDTFAGFGDAPKFPPSMALDFLLRHWARTGADPSLAMVQRTFLAMARGGISDQVGGGLHRYSVDARWLVPHFEKMLYDNALFVRLGVQLWQATGDQEVRDATTRTITWLAREMTAPEGGFFSSLDADSEGHEGVFYVWRHEEIEDALGADAPLVIAAWGITRGGNFEGRSIPHLSAAPDVVARRLGVTRETLDDTLARARETLYARRAARPWPATDDKILAAWNGLMLRALCAAADAFGDPVARALAIANGAFLRDHLVTDHRVMRSWRRGHRLEVGFLEDAAAVALGFLDLFSLTADPAWLTEARAIAHRMIEDFFDLDSGLFHDTRRDGEQLLVRPRDITDNATPSGTSLAAELLARVAVLDADAELDRRARDLVDRAAEALARHPSAFGHLLGVADLLLHGPVEVSIPGGNPVLEATLARSYVPSLVLTRDRDLTPLSRGREAGTAYVCRRYSCDRPTTDPAILAEQLAQAARAT